MFQTTYQLLAFFDSIDKIEGRKKLQKIIHLLKNSGTKFPFKYQYHYYGPYSAQLQFEMNQLVEQNYIEETNHNGAYIYKITDRGRKFKELLEENRSFSFEMNTNILQKLSSENSQFLEVVSTYVFLIDSGDTPEQARKRTKELKPHLAHYLDEAISFYEDRIHN